MIAEALLYAATLPVTRREHRAAIRYSVNLWSRAMRCLKAWADHEANTQKVILAAMSGLRQRRTAVVLGSGLLRDVPIKQMAAAFDTVVLVDLVHLASVRLRLSHPRYRNVRLVERDISGFDDFVSTGTVEPLAFLRSVPYLDFVVSANLLSQVGRGLERRVANHPQGDLPNHLVRDLLRAHIETFDKAPWKTCLISDVSFTVVERSGQQHAQEDLLAGLSIPGIKGTWTWPVVPFGEESKSYQIVHKVVAAW